MMETKEENNFDSKSSSEMEKRSVKWTAVLFYIYLYVFGLIGLYFLFVKAKWTTVFYFLFLVTINAIALTAGAHRFYAHQTFVPTWQLRLFIVLAHTTAGVGSIYDWVFWHRLHHKFYGTKRDPFNHKKGFFYSHVVSNLLSAPSDLNTYARDIDMRDVDSDGYVWLQRKFPVDDNSVFFISKSYWLNYHYVIPWDWKNDEFGTYEMGFITFIIKIWRELGFINQLKTATCDDVREALYTVAISEMTMNEALAKVEKNAENTAAKEKLIYRH